MVSITKIRTNKDGSISYRFKVYLGRKTDGKQLLAGKTVRLKPDLKPRTVEQRLKNLAAEYEREVRCNALPDKTGGDITFGQYAERYLSSSQLSVRTATRYAELLRKINPHLGDIKLSNLTQWQIEDFLNCLRQPGQNQRGNYALPQPLLIKLLQQGKSTPAEIAASAGLGSGTIKKALRGSKIALSSADKIAAYLHRPTTELFEIHQGDRCYANITIREYYRLIAAILNKARQERLVEHNVAREFMKPPKVRSREAHFLQTNELKALIAAVEEENKLRQKAIVYTLAFAGLRRAELLGLDWSDIDFARMKLQVNKTRQVRSGQGIVPAPTKTEKSRRSITIPQALADVLQEWRVEWLHLREQQGPNWLGDDCIFVRKNGLPMHPDSVTAMLHRLAARHGLRDFTPHVLRHTFATQQLTNGVDIKTLGARTGHSRDSTLINIYAHLLNEKEEAAAAIFDDLMRSL